MIKLENANLKELTTIELKATDGGTYWPFVVAYVMVEALLNPSAHISAFQAGYNAA